MAVSSNCCGSWARRIDAFGCQREDRRRPLVRGDLHELGRLEGVADEHAIGIERRVGGDGRLDVGNRLALFHDRGKWMTGDGS